MKDLQECQFDLVKRKIADLSAENAIISELSSEMDVNAIDTALDTVQSKYLRRKLMETNGLVKQVQSHRLFTKYLQLHAPISPSRIISAVQPISPPNRRPIPLPFNGISTTSRHNIILQLHHYHSAANSPLKFQSALF
ncbi:hypothetical protein JTE90_019308 [Oedothorax gibbosus]|uniref:Uncharacterized protein n=1 Tax=Oedothorax gibbosus TaxID=931172 RepID=A0AAV6TNI5_9ARAC|nr:hypothetical protein JTE90_019308 [Oedothorax gibbosus]